MKTDLSTENSLIETVLQGRLDFFRSSALHSPLAGADFRQTKHGALYSSGMDYAPCNGVIANDSNRPLVEDEIESVVQFFSDRKLPFIWWTAAKNLENNGFQFGGILTGIAANIADNIAKKPISPANLNIKIVDSPSDLGAFSSLIAGAFGMNAKTAEQWLQLNVSLLEKGEQINFLALLDNKPVGTATLSTYPTSAGIWNLAAAPDYRKHGIGASLVHAAMLEAKSRYYDQIMAILMPKGMAWGLFTKLGFQSVCEFPLYVYGMSAEELEK